MRARSVVLLSGGLDSSANLAMAAERDKPVLAITFDYGQRALNGEIAAARRFSEYYGVAHRIVDIRWLKALGESRLTAREGSLELLKSDELDDLARAETSAKAVWVPNRNGVLINIAAAFAEDLKADRVVVGFNAEEAATFPDNSLAYMNAATESLRYSTANSVRVHSYTVHQTKIEIVRELKKLSMPFRFDWVWSCYDSADIACGKCESCLRLRRAIAGGEK